MFLHDRVTIFNKQNSCMGLWTETWLQNIWISVQSLSLTCWVNAQVFTDELNFLNAWVIPESKWVIRDSSSNLVFL
jgi:hypothetical protein